MPFNADIPTICQGALREYSTRVYLITLSTEGAIYPVSRLPPEPLENSGAEGYELNQSRMSFLPPASMPRHDKLCRSVHFTYCIETYDEKHPLPYTLQGIAEVHKHILKFRGVYLTFVHREGEKYRYFAFWLCRPDLSFASCVSTTR